ncbi:MAG: thioredoxin-dependent thiol peroxidase [Proteobacteria bacterium]|nr:thioredoxin-dependent thiol peroxidase [Pseudomonadota bacterium]
MTMEVGEQAPDFTLPGDNDTEISLSALRGGNVVVYFYPRDMTPGCTIEARDFTALKPGFDAANTVVIGISKDSPARHDKFVAKHDLKIRLASDSEGSSLDAFAVWKEKTLYGRSFMGIVRSTFLIDAEGIIRQVWSKVKVKGHAQAVLDAAKEL